MVTQSSYTAQAIPSLDLPYFAQNVICLVFCAHDRIYVVLLRVK